ncbi:MAG: type II toxin-antitoxin system VapB family antitoxin [Stagnimonas sp.]|nr:type II toxin-antitoxin system VapB family antitoxin [Stagnimonas sp.]
MRTTLTLNDDLLSKAQSLTGIQNKTRLVHEALLALVERESARPLADLGGNEKTILEAARNRVALAQRGDSSAAIRTEKRSAEEIKGLLKTTKNRRKVSLNSMRIG